MTSPAAAQAWASGANPLGLTEFEVATGVVLGRAESQPWPEGPCGPLEALFGVAREILLRGRCVVAFSGGRDSSAVLATLLHIARREGFDDPIALTARWPGDAATEESAWQEHVARELNVKHWEIITPGSDFDLLGPLTTGLLRDHGLLWPAPIAVLMPMIDVAAGGVFVTGEGGDEVFGTWALAEPWSRLRGVREPQLSRQSSRQSSLRQVVGAGLPRPLRYRRALARERPYQTWLTAEAHVVLRQALARESVATSPLWWDSYLRQVSSERGMQLSARTQAALSAARGGSFASPLLAPPFLAALARRGGRLGLGDRTAAMRAVFSPLLSEAILSRQSKATFGRVFWGPESRQFARDWDGTGVAARWVDAEALRAAWAAPVPVFGAALPLHAAWLANAESNARTATTPGGFLPL
jgi:asparagine synthetase B (glutamine-hydrolysing)